MPTALFCTERTAFPARSFTWGFSSSLKKYKVILLPYKAYTAYAMAPKTPAPTRAAPPVLDDCAGPVVVTTEVWGEIVKADVIVLGATDEVTGDPLTVLTTTDPGSVVGAEYVVPGIVVV
jgi:hypothetical protein